MRGPTLRNHPGIHSGPHHGGVLGRHRHGHRHGHRHDHRHGHRRDHRAIGAEIDIGDLEMGAAEFRRQREARVLWLLDMERSGARAVSRSVIVGLNPILACVGTGMGVRRVSDGHHAETGAG